MVYKLISDITAYFLSVLLSIQFYSISFPDAYLEIDWYLIVGGLVFFVFSVYNYGGYRTYVEFSQLSEYSAIIKASVLTLIVSIIALFLFQIQIPTYLTVFSRVAFIIGLLIIPIVLRSFLHMTVPLNHPKENILIFGGGILGSAFFDAVKRIDNSRFNVIGFVDDNLNDADSVVKPILGSSAELVEICKTNDIHRVVVAIRDLENGKIDQLMSKAVEAGVKLNFVPNMESFNQHPGKLKEFSGIPLVTQNVHNLSPFYLFGKRGLDIIISVISILITSPLWLLIPVMIKADSKGPVFFKQKRVGLDGKEFLMYKFRSMYVDTPQYAYCPVNSNDPRITKTGRWLRKTSLDELPQLINVLKGEMSIVGPRPEMPFIVNQYNEIEKKRLIVKPGLTGLWQISLYRNTEINHNLEYDFYYIQNQSFVLDFVIIVMTFFFAIRGITH